jgi:hypothetical protein
MTKMHMAPSIIKAPRRSSWGRLAVLLLAVGIALSAALVFVVGIGIALNWII